jgi:hypothetical protein
VSWFLLATLSLIIISCCILVTAAAARQGSSEAVKVRLRNDGRVRIEVGWIDPTDQTIHPVGAMEPFGSFQMDSFFGHEFELLELASEGSAGCDVKSTKLSSGDDTGSLQLHDGCVLNTFRVTKRKEQSRFCVVYCCF